MNFSPNLGKKNPVTPPIDPPIKEPGNRFCNLISKQETIKPRIIKLAMPHPIKPIMAPTNLLIIVSFMATTQHKADRPVLGRSSRELKPHFMKYVAPTPDMVLHRSSISLTVFNNSPATAGFINMVIPSSSNSS